MHQKNISLAIGFALLLALIVLIDIFEVGGGYFRLLHDLLFLIPPILAVAGGYHAIKKYGRDSKQSTALTYLTFGLLAWTLGEVTWIVLRIGFGLDPYISVADIPFLIGYFLLFLGIFMMMKITQMQIHRKTLVYIFFPILILAIVTTYFGIFAVHKAEATILQNIISLLHGIGIFAMAILILPLVIMTFEYKGGRLFYSWLYISFGVFATWSGDLLFAVYAEEYVAWEDSIHWIDNVWSLAYLLYAYGLYNIGFVIGKTHEDVLKKIEESR